MDELAHSEPRIVHLPDTDSETFAAFHHWILQQEFLCNIREKQQWCLSLTKIWVFARKMGAPDLANKTMEYMRTTISNNKDATCPSAEAAKYLWEQPDPCSNLRELFTQSFPLTWKEGIDTIGYPSDFVTTALLRYLRETKTVPQVRVKRSDLLKRKSFRHFHEAVPNPETSRITRSSQRIASSQQRSRGTSRGSRARRSLASSQKQRKCNNGQFKQVEAFNPTPPSKTSTCFLCPKKRTNCHASKKSTTIVRHSYSWVRRTTDITCVSF